LQRIKALEKMLNEKERKYKELMKKRIGIDDASEISSNCSEYPKKKKKVLIISLEIQRNCS